MKKRGSATKPWRQLGEISTARRRLKAAHHASKRLLANIALSARKLKAKWRQRGMAWRENGM